MQIYAPGTKIGPYRVLSAPMMGGMGVVYICHDLTNERAVALKTFKPEYLPDRAARDRFLREGTTWVELGKHPHIVRCHNVLYIDPTAFLVLELVVKDEGREDASLRSWMGKPLPLETALAFTLQIARGMQHAAQKIPGFVHRDLKPENVLVGSDKLPGTDVNRLRVTDFGLATLLKDETGRLKEEDGPEVLGRTHLTHGIVGTPLYMAPEQWKGEPVGVYTDVYALGCILYEMLTGERIASGKNLSDLLAAHCGGNLRALPGNLPGAMQAFLRRCLALAGKERYQDWDEVVDALQALCGGPGLPELGQAEDSLAERRDEAYSYNAMGVSYTNMGKGQVAIGYHEKAIAIFREIGDRRGEGNALSNLGDAYQNLGDARRAIGHFEEGLKTEREVGDQGLEGATLGGLGNAYYSLGDLQRAIGYHEQCLEIARKIGDQHREGIALGNLGVVYKDLGDVRRAIGYQEGSLVIKCQIGDRRGEGDALGNLGAAYTALGDVRRAIEYLEEALKIKREIGDRQGEGIAQGNLGIAYTALGDVRRAIGYFEQRMKIAREIGDRRGEVNALTNLGVAYARLGEFGALKYHEEAITIRREIGDINGVAIDSFNMANLYKQQGEVGRAIPLAQEAERIWAQTGSPNVQQARQLLAQLQGGSGFWSRLIGKKG